MDNITLAVLLIGMTFLIPIVVYLSVKLGTYAYFRGRDLYLKQQEGEVQDGDESKRA